MPLLTDEDRDLWRGFRRVFEQINAAIERDLMAATQLSGADHGILARLAAAETTAVRQQDLCDAMRWDRTRLSHHLTRMQQRGLVNRSKRGGGTYVSSTARGERARAEADPVHAEAVQRYFGSRLTAAQRDALAALATSWAGSTGDANTAP